MRYRSASQLPHFKDEYKISSSIFDQIDNSIEHSSHLDLPSMSLERLTVVSRSSRPIREKNSTGFLLRALRILSEDCLVSISKISLNFLQWGIAADGREVRTDYLLLRGGYQPSTSSIISLDNLKSKTRVLSIVSPSQ